MPRGRTFRPRTASTSRARGHRRSAELSKRTQVFPRAGLETVKKGYYRWPVVRGKEVFFVCEDDVYAVSVEGGIPRRLTQAPGACQRPVVSHDGSLVAFSCAEDGYVEVYVVDARGGAMKQLTHMGATYARVCCFSEDGSKVFFASSGATAEPNGDELWMVDINAGAPVRLGIGPGYDFDVRNGTYLLGRNTEDPAVTHWRNYGGGAGGEVWVGQKNNLTRVSGFDSLTGNLGNVQWLDDSKLAFTMETHDGIGAYTCKIDINTAGGQLTEDDVKLSDIQCVHAPNPSYPARHLSADTSTGRLVYMMGGQICMYDPESSSARELDITWCGPRSQLATRFVHADDWIEQWDLHPEGLTMMAIVRGQAFTMGLWDGPVLSYPPAVSRRTGQDDAVPEFLRTLGEQSQPRIRHGAYLFDGERLVYVSDARGEEDIEVHWEEADRPAKRLGLHPELLGRVEHLTPSPEAPLVAIVNHRSALLIVNVETGEMRTADTSSESEGIDDLTWSPCGNWLAYTYYVNNERSCIRILDVRTGKVFDATNPILGDHSPAWDPDGKYLYFLGSRELEPVYDAATFGLAFPHVERPHLIILQKDLRNPLLKELRPPYDTESSSSEYDSESEPPEPKKSKDSKAVAATSKKTNTPDDDSGSTSSDWSTVDGDSDDGSSIGSDVEYDDDDYVSDTSTFSEDAPPPIEIDIDGLTERVVALPMPISRYGCLCGLEDSRFMVVEYPPSRGAPGGVGVDYTSEDDEEGLGSLIAYDVRDLRRSVLIHGGVSEVTLSIDRKCMVVERETDGFPELRVHRAGVRPEEEGSDSEELDQQMCDRRTGLVNLDGRIRVLVDPAREWAQMLGEVYRRVRDDFWDEDMEGMPDWEQVLGSYLGVLPTVSTRTEFADLLREMTHKLGCSHVSVSSGDPGRARRRHSAGYLGADFVWDQKAGGYRIKNIVKGDQWDDMRGGVLSKPGVNLSEGDILLAIDRIPLTEDVSPASLLTEKGGAEVLLTVKIDSSVAIDEALDRLMLKNKNKKPKDDGRPKKGDVVPVRVRASYSELDARYRDVIQNRTARVHQLSDGNVGYLHIPDMESTGYSEFWRHYASEVRKGSLILDLRGNTGGHISELLLSKLSQRALAWDIPRRGELQVYPSNTPGPLVMLVDERTGSDAELMAESFRKLGLGRVVGTRTWGGLLAINGSGDLVDGSELSLPSQNVLLVDEVKSENLRTNNVENKGVIPDVEIRISPDDYSKQEDPQLDRAVVEAMELLKGHDASRAPTSLRKMRQDELKAAQIERSISRKPWSFVTWAPLPPTKEEEEKLKAKKREARLRANGRANGADREPTARARDP